MPPQQVGFVCAILALVCQRLASLAAGVGNGAGLPGELGGLGWKTADSSGRCSSFPARLAPRVHPVPSPIRQVERTQEG